MTNPPTGDHNPADNSPWADGNSGGLGGAPDAGASWDNTGAPQPPADGPSWGATDQNWGASADQSWGTSGSSWDSNAGSSWDSSGSTPAADPYATPAADPYATPAADPYANPPADPYATPAQDPYASPYGGAAPTNTGYQESFPAYSPEASSPYGQTQASYGAPAYGASPYGASPYGVSPYVTPQNHPKAVPAMVCGIISLTCCIPLVGIVGIVLGAMSIKEINLNPSQYGGKGQALAGIICGSIGTLFGFIAWLSYLTGGN